MKHSILQSFRLRLVLYASISGAVTLLADAVFLILLRELPKQFSQLYSNTVQLQKMPSGGVDSLLMIPRLQPEVYAIWLLVSVIFCLLVFITLTAPMVAYLRKLIRGVEQIQNGDLETEIPLRRGDELGELGLAIDTIRMELKKTRVKESEAETLNRELITNVAHDLRTPLTSVIGYLDILRSKEDLPAETQRKYIGIAYDKASRMEGLVADLFDFTKYRSKDVPMNKTKLDIKQFMEQIIDEFYPSLMEHHLDCYTMFCSEPVFTYGDGELLARAFGNLISNAIKYGSDGKQIRIEVGLLPDNMIRVAIINYGRIIPKKDLEHIFDKFYRGDSARRTSGGTGLGLAIAKNVVTLHEGTITAHSDDRGTVFEIRLPIVEGKDVKDESEESSS